MKFKLDENFDPRLMPLFAQEGDHVDTSAPGVCPR